MVKGSFIWVVLLFLAFSVKAQKIWETQMEVDLLPDQQSAMVSIKYQLVLEGDSIRLPLRMIGSQGGVVKGVQVETAEGIDSVFLRAKDHNIAIGDIELDSAESQDSLFALALSYRLPFSNRMTIPVLLVDTKVEAARQASFQAQIKVPAAYSVRSVFPAMTWKSKETSSGLVYGFQMQAIPAWIKLRVFAGKPPFWSLERMIDWGIIVLLGGLIAFGWRYFNKKSI